MSPPIEKSKKRIRDDIKRVNQEIQKVRESIALLDQCPKDRPERSKFITAILTESVNVYSGIESIIESVCKCSGKPVPSSGQFHRNLLNLGREMKIIPADLYEFFSNLMALRHFFKNSYGIPLSEDKFLPELTHLPKHADTVIRCAEDFLREISLSPELEDL